MDFLELTNYHYEHSPAYKRILDGAHLTHTPRSLEEVPYLPASLFKEVDLLSIPREEVFKTLYSSGTSGHPSKIYLDRKNALDQQIALATIVGRALGKGRMPMLVIDTPRTLTDRNAFAARAAGILGFSVFATKRVFALDDEMRLDREKITDFLSQYGDKPYFLFGFTSVVFEKLLEELERTGETLDLSQGVLIHGGGYKKLAARAVDERIFVKRLKAVTGIKKVMNYYGMVEQTGSIYLTCEEGRFHPSEMSAVLVRDPVTLEVVPDGEVGLLQVFTTLATSYPGHSILTEDLGVMEPCTCGEGRGFRVLGRVKGSEIRGCSDAYR